MTTHSKTFPPSGAKGWMHCPAWVPSAGESDQASFGTLCHSYSEQWLITGVKPVGMSDEVCDVISGYVAHCQDLSEWACDFFIEETLHIAITGEPGTVDFAHWYTDNPYPMPDENPTIHVESIDLKTGSSHVKADNPQNRIYMLGLIDAFGLADRGADIICYLSVWQKNRKRTDIIKYSDLKKWENTDLKKAINLRKYVLQLPSDLQESVIKPEFSTCYFCAKKPTCYRENADAIHEFEAKEDL